MAWPPAPGYFFSSSRNTQMYIRVNPRIETNKVETNKAPAIVFPGTPVSRSEATRAQPSSPSLPDDDTNSIESYISYDLSGLQPVHTSWLENLGKGKKGGKRWGGRWFRRGGHKHRGDRKHMGGIKHRVGRKHFKGKAKSSIKYVQGQAKSSAIEFASGQ